MALKRIYDQTLGQLAGVLVTTTGLGQIKRDGTEAFAQAVTNVDSSGTSVDLATEATALDILTALQTPAAELPETPLMPTSDLTHAFVTSSSSGEQDMVSATASQTTKLYAFTITAAAATVVEIRDGASGTALKTIEFPAAGAYVYDLRERPYAKTTANTKLVRNSTVATKVTIDFDYVKSA